MNDSSTAVRHRRIRRGVAAVAVTFGTVAGITAEPAHAASCTAGTPWMQQSGSYIRGVAGGYCTGGATVRVTLYQNGFPVASGRSSGTGWRTAYSSWVYRAPWYRYSVRSTVVPLV